MNRINNSPTLLSLLLVVFQLNIVSFRKTENDQKLLNNILFDHFKFR